MYFIDYEIKNNVYCYPYRDPVDQTLSEAKIRCNVDPLCAMVYDDGGRGSRFRLCDYDAATQPSGDGSRVYIKQGNRRVVLYHCTTNVETIYDLKKLWLQSNYGNDKCSCLQIYHIFPSSGKNNGIKPIF